MNRCHRIGQVTSAICLRAHYAMLRADIRCAATRTALSRARFTTGPTPSSRLRALSRYAHATPCPVLTWRIVRAARAGAQAARGWGGARRG
eukprot:390085-Rhodomonas_salina.1